jgi:hypothetical protein
MVDDPNYDTPLLAFRNNEKWYGNCYNSNYPYYAIDNCLRWESWDSKMYYSTFIYPKSDYKMQEVCISVQDVFTSNFFSHIQEKKVICPNNSTAGKTTTIVIIITTNLSYLLI